MIRGRTFISQKQFILGNTAGEALVRHQDTKIISFTGSTVIGKRIASIAAPMMKRLRYIPKKYISATVITNQYRSFQGKNCTLIVIDLIQFSLELGGKNAAIVFEDAKMDQAITTLIRAGFVNQGEVCLCTSRIFVHEKVYDEFVERYARREKYLQLIQCIATFLNST